MRQKELKHILIGTEKLSKAWEEQFAFRQEGVSEDALIQIANLERSKVGLLSVETPITEAEVCAQDSKFLASIMDDVQSLSAFIASSENFIALAINAWLRDALSIGLVFRSPTDDGHHGPTQRPLSQVRSLLDLVISKRVHEPQFLDMCGQLAVSLLPIVEANSSLSEHVELNLAAIHKLLKRRMKNIHERVRAESAQVPDYEELLRSDRAPLITTSLAQMRHAIEDVYERTVSFPHFENKLAHNIARLGHCLKLPSTTANSPAPSLRTV